MKYGLLVFKETDNIGDDIQSYAAERFLPKIDYYIDRESLNTFEPLGKEKVAVIMNAWYMYNKYAFPPSPYIDPLFISIHFSTSDFFMIEEDFLDQYVKEYFSKYGEIGCRDTSTNNMLLNKGINSYFSGCMTLTLEKEKDVIPENVIYCVDVDNEVVEKAKEICGDCKIIKSTHDILPFNETFDWAKRKNEVKLILQKYQSARCVITTRLHCALPCLALGTPVLLIYKKELYFENRIKDFLPLLNHCTKEDFILGFDYDIANPPQNSNEFLGIKRGIEKRVLSFLDNIKHKESSCDVPTTYWYKQLIRQSVLLKKQLPKLRNLHDRAWLAGDLEKKCDWLKKQNLWLKNKLDGTEQWYQEREQWNKEQTSSEIQKLESENLWLNKKIRDTEHWYQEREQWNKEQSNNEIQNLKNEICWLHEKIKGTEQWYQEREAWSIKHNLIEFERMEGEINCLNEEKKQLIKKIEEFELNYNEMNNSLETMQQNYTNLLSSKVYRIGSIVTFFPRKIIHFLRHLLGKT